MAQAATQPLRREGPRADPLLTVRGLKTHFPLREGTVRAVDGVDFEIQKGRTLGLVGESGCGKSVSALSIMRLIRPPGQIIEGELIWSSDTVEQDLLDISDGDMRRVRGGEISMIFQEPSTYLNPVLTIGRQITEVIEAHWDVAKGDRYTQAVEMLTTVGIPQPEQRMKMYPHELSGGMKQRVMIAMALVCEPKLLLADEPTTALDVTIQAQILELIRELRDRTGMALLLITHDLGVIAEMADDVAVMYAGEIVEYADVETLFSDPKHPYTRGLMNSIPTLATGREEQLNVIRGTVPHMLRLPEGCLFEPRCPYAMNHCVDVRPEVQTLDDGRVMRCHLYPEPPSGAAGELVPGLKAMGDGG